MSDEEDDGKEEEEQAEEQADDDEDIFTHMNKKRKQSADDDEIEQQLQEEQQQESEVDDQITGVPVLNQRLIDKLNNTIESDNMSLYSCQLLVTMLSHIRSLERQLANLQTAVDLIKQHTIVTLTKPQQNAIREEVFAHILSSQFKDKIGDAVTVNNYISRQVVFD